MFVVLGDEWAAGIWGHPWERRGRGRNRGRQGSRYCRAWPSADGLFVQLRQFDGMETAELTFEFSPYVIGAETWSVLASQAELLRGRIGHVERVDVAFDERADPYRFVIDPGGWSKVTRYGCRLSGGAETETIPMTSTRRTGITRYDKAQERLDRAGEVVQGPWMRCELRTREPRRMGSEESETGLGLSELHELAFPVIHGVRLLELVTDPDQVADPMFEAFGHVGLSRGPEFARALARRALGRRRADQMEFVYWQDRLPAYLGVFERGWAHVVSGIRRSLALPEPLDLAVAS